MPSLQVIDAPPDPFNEAIGKFAKQFGETFAKNDRKQQNDQIFERIKSKYGPESKPEDLYRDVLNTPGFDQDYKNDTLKNVKEYVELLNKKDRNNIENIKLDLRRDELTTRNTTNNINFARVKNEQDKIDATAKKAEKNLPKEIQAYSSKQLKDMNANLSAYDKGELDSRIGLSIQENPEMTIDKAYLEALDYIEEKHRILEQEPMVEKPSSWASTLKKFVTTEDPKVLSDLMEKAVQKVRELYDAGIESQKELRKFIKKGKWDDEETTAILQKALNKKEKSPKKQYVKPPIDDILFGGN